MHFPTSFWLCGIVFSVRVLSASLCQCHTATAWKVDPRCSVEATSCRVLIATRIPPSVRECPVTPTVTSTMCPGAGCFTTYSTTVVPSDCTYRNNPGDAPPPPTTTITYTISTTTTFTTTATVSSIPPSSGLNIVGALWGDVDVSDKATGALQQGSRLVVDMSNISNWLGRDAWVGIKKCLSLLHTYGSSIRTFVSCEGDGTFTLVPGNVNLSPLTQEITRQGPSSPSFSIVSVVWGALEIRDASVYQAIYEFKRNGSAIPFTNAFFGNDTFPNNSKSGVIWYSDDNFRSIKTLHAKELSSVGF